MRNIYELLGVPHPVTVSWNKATPLPSPDPTRVFGVELEIENASFEWETQFWTAKEDGSLRNHGVEFVSKPTTYSVLVARLEQFYAEHQLRERKENDITYSADSNFSDRTSIHVHSNCTDITAEQLSTICLIYSVVERLLYRFIGNERDMNIFCVPWYETTINHRVINSIVTGNMAPLRRWHKYTGLNLLTLTTLGTIEWRHMHGNCDIEFIAGWLRLISHHYRVAKSISFEELQHRLLGLNTTSQYRNMLDFLFEKDASLLHVPGYDLLLEEGVLSAKYAYNSNMSKTEKSDNTMSAWLQQVANHNDVFNTTAPVVGLGPGVRDGLTEALAQVRAHYDTVVLNQFTAPPSQLQNIRNTQVGTGTYNIWFDDIVTTEGNS